jgi:hypothetical protein
LARIFERWSTVRDSDDVDRYARRSVGAREPSRALDSYGNDLDGLFLGFLS